jgi:hypothetical protein
VRFNEKDNPVGYAEPTGFPEALSVWTSPVSMAGLEAIVERIQSLRDNHLAAHHMVNSFVHHNIAPLQRRSCPHWEVLSRNHPIRLHRENPSEDEIIRVSNFLTCSNQTELLRPQRIRALIWLEAKERAAIIASMPLCEEWGPIAVPAAPEVAVGAAGKELTMAQRSHLVNRLLAAQEAIEEGEGSDALAHLPRRRLRPSHLASPRTSAPGMGPSIGASTSRAIPVSGPSLDAVGWDDLEWGCLLDPPR